MNAQQMSAELDSLHQSMAKMLAAKAVDYAGEEDRFGNFKRRGQLMKMTPSQVIFADMMKHVDATGNILFPDGPYIGRPTQGIQERLMDLITYAFLLMCREAEVRMQDKNEQAQAIMAPAVRFDSSAKQGFGAVGESLAKYDPRAPHIG